MFYKHNQYFVFRPLLVSECESLTNLSEKIDTHILDEWIVSKAILSKNKDYLLNEAPAGLLSSLAGSVLKHSMPKDIKSMSDDLSKERELAETTNNLLDFMVKAGAGSLLSNTKDITYKQQIQYAVFSEQVLGKKIEFNTAISNKNGKPKKISPETLAILSKNNAEKPDFAKDNAALKGN